MRELNDIRVTWQLAVVVCALAILPVAGVALVSGLVEPDQRGANGVRVVCGTIIITTLLLCVVAIRSRLLSVPNRDSRASILMQIGIGVVTITAAAGLSAVSYLFGTFQAFGHQFYLVPSGLYAVGIVLIGKAMVPASDA